MDITMGAKHVNEKSNTHRGHALYNWMVWWMMGVTQRFQGGVMETTRMADFYRGHI